MVVPFCFLSFDTLFRRLGTTLDKIARVRAEPVKSAEVADG